MKHPNEFEELVNDAKLRIREVTVGETLERICAGARLIDVHEESEFGAGNAENAIHFGRGIIERVP